MSLLGELWGFWRVVRRQRGSPPHGGHSLARTLRDSTHVKGGQGTPRASTEAQHRIVAEGHRRYTESFGDDDRSGSGR